jgi:import inner membrane translocase subunit TIM50
MLSRAVIGSLQNAPGRTAPANLRIASSTTWSRAVSSSSCTPSVHSIYNTIWRTKPAVFPIAVSTWSRSMARNNRPNSNNNKPIEYSRPLGTPTPSKPERVAFTSAIPPQRARSSNESDKPGFSKSQVEVDSNSAPARNTVPLSKGTGFGALHNAQKNGEESEFSGKQEEFETAPLSENTAAQSASPSAIDPAEASAPSQPLPDLTRGIPSTLQFETTGSSKLSPLDVTEAEESGQPLGGGRGKGELPASAYVSSSDKKRARFANIMYGMVLLLVTTGGVYLGRNWEEEEEERAHPDAPSGWALGLMWNRAKARLGDQANYYSEPAFPKLLPDPDPIFERPYTLVLSMEDLLIHSEWSREHGWRMAKRPGVDYFLRYLSQYYELVIFTSQPWAVAEPVIRKLDPFHIVTWPLFREATKYENGAYVKVCTTDSYLGFTDRTRISLTLTETYLRSFS